MKAPYRTLLPLALLALLAPALAGCFADNSEAGEPDVAADATLEADDDRIPVAALPLRRGRLESVLRFSTNRQSVSEVEVYSQASRRVVELLVEEGDAVKAGQLLLRLQDDEQRTALARVESQLGQARRELERQMSLYSQDLIPEQAFVEAQYQVEQLEISLRDAERQLSYAEVRAPIAGVVTRRLVDLGDTVQSNDHLFDLVDLGSMQADIFVPEREVARLKVGQAARLRPQAPGSKVSQGRIKRILPVVDPKSGTVKVTLHVPSEPGLLPGMYVEVELVAEVDEDALLVPKRALIYDQEQTFVFRVGDDGRVERRRIRPTLENRDFVRVSDELAAGDRIVVAGQAGLKDGAEVRLLDLEEALATFADDAASPF